MANEAPFPGSIALVRPEPIMRADQIAWGIGRHLLGSQLFDYWRDGDGHEHEHYADGDVFDDTYPTQDSALERGALWQWGVDLPSDFTPKLSPALLRDMARELFAGRLDFGTLRALVAAGGKRPRPWLR